MNIYNIYAGIPEVLPGEVFENIIRNDRFKLERIVSSGHSTPEGQWYDQDTDEWVILLVGEAGLHFEGEKAPHTLKPGDYIHIPAHVKHRVAWTKENEKTVWLAIHYKEESHAF